MDGQMHKTNSKVLSPNNHLQIVPTPQLRNGHSSKFGPLQVCLIYTYMYMYLAISLCDLLSHTERNKCLIHPGNKRSCLEHIILMSFVAESVNGKKVYDISRESLLQRKRES